MTFTWRKRPSLTCTSRLLTVKIMMRNDYDIKNYHLPSDHLRTSHTWCIVPDLTNGALYFAMRSCDYIIQLREESKKEEIKNWNIAFYNSRGHRLKKRKNFANAHCVKITFENQKNGEKMEPITHILWREADSYKQTS